MDSGDWWATVRGIGESGTTEHTAHPRYSRLVQHSKISYCTVIPWNPSGTGPRTSTGTRTLGFSSPTVNPLYPQVRICGIHPLNTHGCIKFSICLKCRTHRYEGPTTYLLKKKNLRTSGPRQFEPRLFRGQLQSITSTG